jgi:hypothetical protein
MEDRVTKAAAPAKSHHEPIPETAPAQPTPPEPGVTETPSPARLLLDEYLIEESDLARELKNCTIRALSNLAKKHGLRRISILKRIYYRRDSLTDFFAKLGQRPARRRRPR